jgi:hypothetical protein
MINTNLKFMKSKEITPHEFYFLDESPFANIIVKLREKTFGSLNISTIGFIEYEYSWFLNFENAKILLNISRVVDLNPITKKEKNPNYYMIYGELRLDNHLPVLIVHFYRNLGNNINIENYKNLVMKRRELLNEALQEDFLI